MNEAAKAAGRDPLEFRLDTQISRLSDSNEIEGSPRLRKVMEMAAERAGWGRALAEGHAHGVFDRYRVVRMNEMPEVEAIIVFSGDAHGAVGEPATPPIAGAVAGALLALTGIAPRSLPLV